MLPALGLITIAVLAGFTLRSTGKPRAGLAIALLGIVLSASMFVSAALVTTERETVQDHLRALVAAVAQGSAPDLERLLDPDVVVNTRFADAEGRDRVVALSVDRAAPYVEEHSIGEIQAELLGPRVARTHAKIKTQGSSWPTQSWWRVDWVRRDAEDDAWRATHIEPIWIQGFDRAGG